MISAHISGCQKAATGRSTGFRVYLGTIPNYADSTDGLLLDGVRDDFPAAQAGAKAGDRIVKLAGRDVTQCLRLHCCSGRDEGGQEYEVEFCEVLNVETEAHTSSEEIRDNRERGK